MSNATLEQPTTTTPAPVRIVSEHEALERLSVMLDDFYRLLAKEQKQGGLTGNEAGRLVRCSEFLAPKDVHYSQVLKTYRSIAIAMTRCKQERTSTLPAIDADPADLALAAEAASERRTAAECAFNKWKTGRPEERRAIVRGSNAETMKAFDRETAERERELLSARAVARQEAEAAGKAMATAQMIPAMRKLVMENRALADAVGLTIATPTKRNKP